MPAPTPHARTRDRIARLRGLPEAAIRFVAYVLIALLLATALGIGGYGALLAMRRTGSVAASPTTTPPPHEALPAPARLPASSDFTRTVAATAAKAHAGRLALTIVVRGLPTELRGDHTGVAVTPLAGPGEVTWLPLAAAIATPTGDLELHTTVTGTGDLQATIATEPFAAKGGWLARATANVTGDGTRLVLDAPAIQVTFQPAEGVRHAGPFWLRRRDATDWQAPGSAAAGVSVRDGQPCTLWLGHGDYELCDPLRPDRSFAFTTPATASVSLSDALATPRTDRP